MGATPREIEGTLSIITLIQVILFYQRSLLSSIFCLINSTVCDAGGSK